jgi:hypothetical protein
MAQQRPYPITLDERRLATLLSRFRTGLRKAGMGHLRPYDASSATGCRAPKAAIAARNSGTASPINDGPLLSPAGVEERQMVEKT